MPYFLEEDKHLANLEEHFDIGQILDGLEESQAQKQRHKSPHAAFAKGYLDGVNEAYS